MILSAEARALHASSLFVDLHCDLLLAKKLLGWDWRRRHAPNPLPGAALFGHCDIPRLKEGGVSAMALGVVINPLRGRSGPAAIDADLARMAQEVARSPEDLAVCGTVQAIRTARAQGRIACFAGLEGAHGLDTRLEDLPRFRAAGLRYVGLAHFSANAACRPMVGWGADNTAPLSDYGRALVDELGRLGILVDLAHVGRAGVIEAAARANKPVIISHTACTAVHASPRGVDDGLLRAVADTDGVVGVIFVTPFLGQHPSGKGGAAQVVRHLDHIRRTVGVRHAAIGTDWEGFALYPSDLDSADKLPWLTQALLDAGWPPADVHAVLGENFLRVFGAVCG
ncbi:MAG: membrane dipeptidase [Pseudomonadota bacterium]|nr:membrane dipeptidase [Pseudomonadota bacterium]